MLIIVIFIIFISKMQNLGIWACFRPLFQNKIHCSTNLFLWPSITHKDETLIIHNNSYIIHVFERDFFIECIEKIPIKNKRTINNLYPYMDTPFLAPFGLLFLFHTSDQQIKNIHFVGDHPMNISTKFGSN